MATNRTSPSWKTALQTGLLGGAVTLLICLIGMVESFGKREIITDVLTMGQVMYIGPMIIFGYLAARRAGGASKSLGLLWGALAGLIAGVMLSGLVALGTNTNLRDMFVNASPALFKILTFDVPLPLGYLVPPAVGLLAGLFGAVIIMLPARLSNAIIQGMLWVILLGLLRDQIVTVFQQWPSELAKFVVQYTTWLFAFSGLRPLGAAVAFIVVAGVSYWRYGKRAARPVNRVPVVRSKSTKIALIFGIAVVLLVLPQVVGIFFSEVLDNVGLYILMGLGLNIVVGYAGLLDLGYVAFYAIGAYTMGVLTSPAMGGSMTFWQALPIALLASVAAGVILGLPVLRLRGDYLAIVTLGFGEIIRILVLSDWLAPMLGGSQGIQTIQQPLLGSFKMDSQQDIYYLILAGILVAAFVAWRLKDSRVGRAWMALREDEDVAQAMGINLVGTKLMAFGMGALFSGLSGTIFAAKLTSAYPSSFQFIVSINVLALIIVGGMGSIPGVFVGALVMVGLPELLREFAEYRLLVYGAVLVAMMLFKPEGLWPEARRKLELHEEPDEELPHDHDLTPAMGIE